VERAFLVKLYLKKKIKNTIKKWTGLIWLRIWAGDQLL
jgi:hypothetical protein